MKRSYYLSLLGIAFCFASCEQKDLCLDHWEHAPRYNYEARIKYNPQWELFYEDGINWRENWNLANYEQPYDSLLPGIPEGVRALVYNTNTYYDTYNLPTYGGRIGISEGQHEILFFNNDTEYIVFNDLNKAVEASATTRTRVRSTYMGSSAFRDDEPEHTVNPPDMLYAHYIPDYNGTLSTDLQYIDITMQPLVFRYIVRYHFKYGIQYVRLARGAMAGMAATVNLTDGSTPNDKATVLYDIDIDVAQIKAHYAAQLKALAAAQAAKAPTDSRDALVEEEEVGTGCITAIVNSFGVPGYPNPYYTRATGSYGLNLEVRLGNGKIFNFDFDISEQMARQPRGGIIDVYGITISDDDGKESSGAFDIDVEGWSQHEDINIFTGNVDNSK